MLDEEDLLDDEKYAKFMQDSADYEAKVLGTTKVQSSPA